MITNDTWCIIVDRLGQQALDDIMWAENIGPPESADEFALEAIYVICNSGMRHTVARQIYDRVVIALKRGDGAATAFDHAGKAKAIDTIWEHRAFLLADYLAAEDKVEWCGDLPWIGGITKWHLAKNFGADVAKPDVHLVRLAGAHGTTVKKLCETLAAETGYRVATIDTVLWRACATGVLDGFTGQVREAA